MATLYAAISFSAKVGRCKAPAVTWKGSGVSGRNLISMGATRTGLIFLRPSRFRVCVAKAETVSKVMDIVKQQLALGEDAALTPESRFTEFGADSLDTVEIVMALEEEFKITVEEDNAQSITTIQEAADLIDKLVDEKPAA
ncbi:acyl carrier protein 4, chloroplastic-like [Phragmites australis]|uniref:acyl carrier protein 4, chloroplastic-like n=1 Tax=Phragmites australis TaxID=29695 RepID=UPI002D77E1BB|nr:acyl carrier protein 4, chloroplastic-like [Phragmites australis]